MPAPLTGSITITGTVKKKDTSGGDGVNVKIMKNGTQIWPASGWRSIAYNDATGYSVNISTPVDGERYHFVYRQCQQHRFLRLYGMGSCYHV